VANKKRRDLALTIATIQRKWGLKALRQLDRVEVTAKIPHVPTGFPTLDKALGIGGIPRSRMTEILGVPTSGMTTLAMKIMASAQAEGDTAAYIDLSRTFDADYAHRCEVDLSKLVLVRPHSGNDALAITQDLIASRGVGILIFDAASDLLADVQGQQLMATRLRQLIGLLAKSPCALIFLTLLEAYHPPTDDSYALAHYATLRLFIEKERWITKRRDVRGYRAQVFVAKNKLGAGGQRATIAITFNGTVRGDGT
jgi:recombination protein RecA